MRNTNRPTANQSVQNNPLAADLAAALEAYGPRVGINDAARIACVSNKTILRRIAAGKLESYRFGGTRAHRVRVVDIFEMIGSTGGAS